MTPRPLKEKYKTRQGASKRCAFENVIARFEYEKGYKAKRYQHFIVFDGSVWRVMREPAEV